MFTGIIEETGTIGRISRGRRSVRLSVNCRVVTGGTKPGDSIAVNGVCLTATSVGPDGFTADVMEETVARSSLAALSTGSIVNLERAMPADGRFGGHIVAGHVDGTGIIRSVKKDEMAVVFRIDMRENTQKLLRYIVEKGSVAVDGISLTVASVDATGFEVSIIPHTIAHTTLSEGKPGDIVNIETDLIGKYVEKLLSSDQAGHGALAGDYDSARAFLSNNGF